MLHSKVRPKLIYLMTSNPDKVTEYQRLFELSGAPVIVQSADVFLRDFYHARELSESVEGNLEEKRDVLADMLRVLKEGDSKSSYFKYPPKRKELLKQITDNINQLHLRYPDIPKITDTNLKRVRKDKADQATSFIQNDVYFAVEDSSLGVAPVIWKQMDKTNIPKETLERVDTLLKKAPAGRDAEIVNAEFVGPGAEYAPVVAALSTKELVRRINHTASNLNMGAPKVAFFSMLNMTNIKDAEFTKDASGKFSLNRSAFKSFKGRSTQYTLNSEPLFNTAHPAGINAYLIPTEHDVLGTNAANYQAHQAYHDALIQRSARSVIEKQINQAFFGQESFPESQLTLSDRPRKNNGHAIRIAQFDTHKHTQSALNPALIRNNDDVAEKFTETLRYVERALDKSDVLVLPPVLHADTPKDLQHFIDLYTINSLVTAKMLISRDKPKQIVLQNIPTEERPKGYWHDAIALHHHFVENALCRDAVIDPTPWFLQNLSKAGVTLTEKVNILHNDYFTMVSGAANEVSEASQALIEYWREHLIKVTTPATTKAEVEIDTIGEDDGRLKVGIFLSAKSEHDRLMQTTRDFAASLASKNIGIVYGGGDQHLMGAVYEGVKKYADTHTDSKPILKGYSTHEILKTETKEGRFPKKSELKNLRFYGKMCEDIYQRMADIFADSDVLLYRTGGAGTMQELTAALVLRKLHPELAAGKPIIICDVKSHKTDAESFYQPIIEHVFRRDGNYRKTNETMTCNGKPHSYEKLSDGSNHEAPIYIVHDDAVANKLIDEMSSQYQHNRCR